MSFTVALTDPDGVQRDLDPIARSAAEYVDGGVYAVDLPPPLAPGEYRLGMTASIGRVSETREIAFYRR